MRVLVFLNGELEWLQPSQPSERLRGAHSWVCDEREDASERPVVRRSAARMLERGGRRSKTRAARAMLEQQVSSHRPRGRELDE